MSKSFLDYLKDEQGKKWNKIVKKLEKKINDIGVPILRKEAINISDKILEHAENERNVSLKEEQKNSLNPLEHAMLIYEGLGKTSKGRGTIISDDMNDPLAHAAMLL